MEKINLNENSDKKILVKQDLEFNIEDNINSNLILTLTNESKKINIDIKKNSNIDIYIIIGEKIDSKYNLVINQKENSITNLKIVTINNNSNGHIEINLNQINARSDYKLIAVNEKNNKIDVQVRTNNNAKKTFSNILQKGVVANSGIINFNATGFIKKDSDKAENYQESRILLLDEAGRGEASPLLLIDHFDVLAGHKASVSRVDEDTLFYLNSRAIKTKNAEKLIIKAFITPLIDDIKVEEIKEDVINLLEQKIY